MAAEPMRPWQTRLALLAAAPLAVALLPVPIAVRIVAIALAVSIAAALFVLRMRSIRAAAVQRRDVDVWDRIERIRAARAERYGGGSRPRPRR